MLGRIMISPDTDCFTVAARREDGDDATLAFRVVPSRTCSVCPAPTLLLLLVGPAIARWLIFGYCCPSAPSPYPRARVRAHVTRVRLSSETGPEAPPSSSRLAHCFYGHLLKRGLFCKGLARQSAVMMRQSFLCQQKCAI
jgi:hypothetical protein